jgi:hypothetical protein
VVPSARGTVAALSSIRGVGITKDVVMLPNVVVGCEQRHIWQIADAVIRVAQHALPRRLGIAGTGAADDTRSRHRWRAGRAAAGTATPSGVVEEVRLSSGAVAEAARPVSHRASRDILRDQHAGAGVIPRNFRDIGLGRTKRCGVGGVPIGGIGSGVCVAEIGAPDRHIIGSGRQCIHANAVHNGRGVSIALPGLLVAGGHEDRHPFGDALLVDRVVGGVARSAVQRFATAIADADDGGRARGVDQICTAVSRPSMELVFAQLVV